MLHRLGKSNFYHSLFLCFQEEERFWLNRQLRMCNSRGRSEVNFGSEAIGDLAHYLSEDTEASFKLNDRILGTVANVLTKRCYVFFWCHHEYRQLYKPSKQTTFSGTASSTAEADKVAKICETFDANVTRAVAFLLAYLQSVTYAEEQNQ